MNEDQLFVDFVKLILSDNTLDKDTSVLFDAELREKLEYMLMCKSIPTQFLCSQFLWIMVAHVTYPYSEQSIEVFEQILQMIFNWIQSQEQQNEDNMDILRCLIQIVALLVERDELLSQYAIFTGGESILLQQLCNISSTPHIPMMKLRCMQAIESIIDCRVETRECLSRNIQQQYINMFHTLFHHHKSHSIHRINNSTRDKEQEELIEIAYGCFETLTEPKLHLVNCGLFLTNCISSTSLNYLIKLSTHPFSSSSSSTSSSSNRKLKQTILAQSILNNILNCPAAWSHHIDIAESKWLSSVARNLYLIEPDKNKKHTEWMIGALYGLSKFVSAHITGDQADRLIMMEQPNILEKLMFLINCTLSTEHHIFSTMLSLAEQSAPCLLLQMLRNGYLESVFKYSQLHQTQCHCNLFPHNVIPVADRILAHFPWILTMNDNTSMSNTGLAIMTALQQTAELKDICFHKYYYRSKLLLERHFTSQCLYNID